jgi:hypothetical protein
VGQAFSRVGSPDPRLTRFGTVDPRLLSLFHAWSRLDPPPTRVRPLPLPLLQHTVTLARLCATPFSAAVADCLILAFFFLLRPGEYAGTPSRTLDNLFRLADVSLWLGSRQLDLLHAPVADLQAATFATLTFTTQKNGVRGERIGHSRSGHPSLCPVLCVVSRILHLRSHHAVPSTPLNAVWQGRWTYVLPTHITQSLRAAVRLHPSFGFSVSDVSARSTRAGGAMALLCGGIDSDRIRLIGRWRSDEMYRYLHVQAQPVMNGVAAAMFRGGHFHLHPGDPTLLPLPVP